MDESLDAAAASILKQVSSISEGVDAWLKIYTSTPSQIEHNRRRLKDGMSILDVKTATLLRYNVALCRFAAARLQLAEDDEVEKQTQELVKHWVTLERIRPIEKKLRPQITSLLDRAARPRTSAAHVAPRPDPANLAMDDEDDEEGRGGRDEDNDDEVSRGGRRRGGSSKRRRSSDNGGDDDADDDDGESAVDDMDGSSDEDAGARGTRKGTESGLYRPPRIAEVIFDGDREAIEQRERRTREKMAARLARSRGVREMLGDISGRPDLVRDDDMVGAGGDADGPGGQSAREFSKLRREEEDRTRFEEDNFTRLNVTRKDMQRRRFLERSVERTGALGSAMGDEFADLMGVANRVIGKSGSGSAARQAAKERVEALDALERTGGHTRSARKGQKSGRGRRK